MTKSKKIVAVLGVVAGLGAIAFPLTSYAATQDVNITVGVDETVAISVNNPSVSKNIATSSVGENLHFSYSHCVVMRINLIYGSTELSLTALWGATTDAILLVSDSRSILLAIKVATTL